MQARAARQFGMTRTDLRLCGARTRAGGECANQPVKGRRRCRMHGGKSYAGFAHPNYKHGWRSNDPLHRLMRAQVRRNERERERRDEVQRKVEAQIAAETEAREAREARAAARRPKWNVEALQALAERTHGGTSNQQ